MATRTPGQSPSTNLPVVRPAAESNNPTREKLAKTAAQTGKLVTKASVKVARPIARTLKQEEPRTLAKMLIAAAAPRIAIGVLKFAVRNPVIAVGGVLLFAALSQMNTDDAGV